MGNEVVLRKIQKQFPLIGVSWFQSEFNWFEFRGPISIQKHCRYLAISQTSAVFSLVSEEVSRCNHQQNSFRLPGVWL
jgi:hypothetical protein